LHSPPKSIDSVNLQLLNSRKKIRGAKRPNLAAA
jgi:hypothetical protein